MPTSDPSGGTPTTTPTVALPTFARTQSVQAAQISAVHAGEQTVVVLLPGAQYQAIADGALFFGPRMPQTGDWYVIDATTGAVSVMPAAAFAAAFG